MKYTLFLLAAIDAVCGATLGAKLKGVTTIGDPCTVEEQQVLYQECVEHVAIDMGFVHSRRLELRGGRELVDCGVCGPCPECYPTGHWCVVWCSTSRRLLVADEHVHTDRFLYTKGHIQQAANECLDLKIEEGYKCLGNPEDLTIQIFLSE